MTTRKKISSRGGVAARRGRATRAAALVAITLALACPRLAADAPPAAPPTAPAAASSTAPASQWTLGIARFSPDPEAGSGSSLSDTIPLLIASELESLPLRHRSEEESSELAALGALRTRFTLGAELAAKLDSRALRFFDPRNDADAWKANLGAADKLVSTAKKAFEQGTAAASAPSRQGPADLPASLWDGNAKGRLIDVTASTPGKAAKDAKVDLLVTGSVTIMDGYAAVTIDGYDANLERGVFSWKSYCSVDDPGPLASDFALRLERWTAGREFGRLELSVDPPSAELWVDGKPLDAVPPVVYSYGDARLRVSASAAGYSPRVIDEDITLGERKRLVVTLSPIVTGQVNVTTQPDTARISLDSLPIGQSPLSIALDGSRRILDVEAKGRETQTLILPPSGQADLAITLQSSDGLGPKGRILAAKDGFYSSFGWFVLSIPVTALSLGVYNGYAEAYGRSTDPSLYNSSNVSYSVFLAAAAATAVTGAFMVARLIKYLAIAR